MGQGRRTTPIEILFDDEHMLVVNKPAGVLSVPDREGQLALPGMLAAQLGLDRSPLVVHRLDRQTSGAIVLARTEQAHRVLCEQFQQHTVAKHYLALVRGVPEVQSGQIDAAIAPHRSRPGLMLVARSGGRPAQTRWMLLAHWQGVALLRCRPVTGRQHQIRVHLAHVGMPLLVDELYGSARGFLLSEVKADYHPSRQRKERPLIRRLTLHAECVSLIHPSGTGSSAGAAQPAGLPVASPPMPGLDELLAEEPGRAARVARGVLTVRAPLPRDFRATLLQLRKLGL